MKKEDAFDAFFLVTGLTGAASGVLIGLGLVTTAQLGALVASVGLTQYWGFILAGFSIAGVAELIWRRR